MHRFPYPSGADRVRPVVLLTGSSGRIGRAVADRLRHRYQVIGLDRQGNPRSVPEMESICVDLTDEESVRCGLERVRFAYGDRVASVVHLAAYYDFSGEPSPLYEEVTVRGTERLLRALRRQAFSVEQFIFSSTMLVHAPTEPGRPITEHAPLDPRWDYPRSKVRTEQLIDHLRESIPVVILRIAGVYTDTCDSIPLSHQIRRIRERHATSRVFPGDLTHGQAYVHLDDLVSVIALAVLRRRDLAPRETFLIGEQDVMSYEQLQRAIARQLHGEAEWFTQEIPSAVAKAGAWIQNKVPGVEEPFIKPWMIDFADDHYELDISRARDRLGWTPHHRLDETLPLMIEALEADPVAWYRRHGLDVPEEERDVSRETEPARA